MSNRALSPWWGLLIIPVALPIGWMVGQGPIPERKAPPETAVQSQAPAGARAEAQRSVARRDAGEPGFLPEASAQPSGAPPVEEPKRAEVSQWTSMDGALAESKRNGKPVLIDFNAEWCPPCRRLKQEVFDDGARGQAVQTAVIPVSIVDRQRETGSNSPEVTSLQQRYDVDALPTLIVFSPETGRSVKTKGFGDADATLQWITNAARSVR